jgi:hypothetical protein
MAVPDLPELPKRPGGQKRQGKRKPRVTTSREWIERGPLAPWMYAYAQWLAEHPEAVLRRPGGGQVKRGRPRTWERTAAASRFARRKIRTMAVGLLESREDFRAYFQRLRDDAQFLAREIARQKIAKNLEVRDVALDRAAGRVEMPDGTVTYGKMDVKAVEQFTRPYVELAFPKKLAEEEQKPRIVLHLGSGESKKLLGLAETDDIQDVSFEVIETPKLLEGGEED